MISSNNLECIYAAPLRHRAVKTQMLSRKRNFVVWVVWMVS